MNDSDRRLHLLAARQHACLTFAQAHECGLSASQISWRLAAGTLVRAGDHVLCIAGAPPTWEQQLMAGLLDLGDGAAVSRRAAAALHRLDGFPRVPVEFTVPRRRRGRRSSWSVHTATELGRMDTELVGKLNCTSATRTILDLARHATRAELERAIDSAIRGGLTSPTYLAGRLHDLRGPGRWGVRLLDELVVDSGGHSPLERAFLALVRRAGLPRPTCQRVLSRDGHRVARVDFSFEPRPLLVEVSGRLGHASDAERAKDARRRNELQSLGFVVLEFTYDDIVRRPGYVIETLRRHGL